MWWPCRPEPLSPFLAKAVPWPSVLIAATFETHSGLRGTIGERMGRKVLKKGCGKT